MITPNPPINRRPAITKPIGTDVERRVASTNVGNATGAGGVKVASRVDVETGTKATNRVGLIVGVVAGVGVGGTGIIGKFAPLVKDT